MILTVQHNVWSKCGELDEKSETNSQYYSEGVAKV